MSKGKNMMRRVILLGVILFLAAAFAGAAGEEALKIKMPETVKGYTPCTIRIQSPFAGEAEMRMLDPNDNLWRVIRTPVSAGENKIAWDGLGENLERMFAGPYRFEITVTGENGETVRGTAKFEISGTTPTLVYALPSSETLYLDGSQEWFVELYVSASCTVDMEIRDGKTLLRKEKIRTSYQSETVRVTGQKGAMFRWNGSLGSSGKTLQPGDYTLVFYSENNPDYSVTCPLHAEEGPCPAYEVGPTGPVVPERGMTDEEIWEIMMKPSVVINGAGQGVLHPFELYAEPSSRSKVTGSVRGDTQGLEVLSTDGKWAYVRAYNYKDSRECEGYIRMDRLRVELPQKHYGLLIDKRDQTLTVYLDGKPVGTVAVSTGKPANHQYETAAGAFLTAIRDQGGSFAQEGFRYEYPIRYNAGNMIHGLGYTRVGRPRDYSRNLPQLGEKATHGCIRVSSFVTEECPINLFWIWTRAPYHTRVIILDDGEGMETDNEDS